MARKNTFLTVLISFAVILLLIPLVRFLFPGSISGFQPTCPMGKEKDASGNCVNVTAKPAPQISETGTIVIAVFGGLFGTLCLVFILYSMFGGNKKQS
jgi:hypothetical protein